jgi:hypothetical protein
MRGGFDRVRILYHGRIPMKKSLWMQFKPPLVRLALEVMPFIPLPKEWYRTLLVKDSENRYATGRWNYLQEVSESHRYNAINWEVQVNQFPCPPRIISREVTPPSIGFDKGNQRRVFATEGSFLGGFDMLVCLHEVRKYP